MHAEKLPVQRTISGNPCTESNIYTRAETRTRRQIARTPSLEPEIYLTRNRKQRSRTNKNAAIKRINATYLIYSGKFLMRRFGSRIPIRMKLNAEETVQEEISARLIHSKLDEHTLIHRLPYLLRLLDESSFDLFGRGSGRNTQQFI